MMVSSLDLFGLYSNISGCSEIEKEEVVKILTDCLKHCMMLEGGAVWWSFWGQTGPQVSF